MCVCVCVINHECLESFFLIVVHFYYFSNWRRFLYFYMFLLAVLYCRGVRKTESWYVSGL